MRVNGTATLFIWLLRQLNRILEQEFNNFFINRKSKFGWVKLVQGNPSERLASFGRQIGIDDGGDAYLIGCVAAYPIINAEQLHVREKARFLKVISGIKVLLHFYLNTQFLHKFSFQAVQRSFTVI